MSGGSDDIESRITKLTLAPGLPREVWSELCRIDSDLRAQRAASRERVIKAIVDAADGPRDRYDEDQNYDLGELIDDVATAAADAIDALAAPQPALDAARVREVVERAVADWLAMNCAPSSTMADVQVASAVMGKGIASRVVDDLATPQPRDDRRPLPPEVMTGALQDTVHEDAGPGRPARSVRVARVLDAARVREVVREVVTRELNDIRPLTTQERVERTAARAEEQLAGQAVALSAEDRTLLQIGRDWSMDQAKSCPENCGDGDVWRDLSALLDRLLSTPGQVARPSVARIRYTVASPGPSIAEELAEEEAASDSAAPHPGPASSTVVPELCRRLASDLRANKLGGELVQWIDRRYLPGDDETADRLAREIRDEIDGGRCEPLEVFEGDESEIARQLTAAADLRDAFNSLQAVAKDAQDQLRAERNRARAAAADAHEDWKRMQAERDAARREAARLAEAFEEATGKLAVAVTAQENAEHDLEAARRELAELKERHAVMVRYWDREASKICDERDAARAECERLRDERDGLQKYGDTWAAAANAWQHDLELARDRIRALLATEPAVSEERCGEIAKSRGFMIAGHHHRERSEIAKSLADHIPDLLAAARQLHALRAGLREIVGTTGSVTHRCARCNVVLCSSDDSVDAAIEAHRSVCSGPGHSDAVPRSWAVTPERVEALRWVVGLSGATAEEWARMRDEASIRLLAAMLAEVPEIVGGEATSAPTRAALDARQLFDLQRMREDYRVALKEVAKQAERFPRIEKFAEARDERRRHLWLLDHLLSLFGGTQT